jgi:hypothetical protein
MALSVTVEGRKERKQFCAFSARPRFHTGWTHLRHRLNDEQTDNGHNFLRPRGRLNPWKKSGLAQRHRVLVGCAAASMRYHNEIRVISRLMAKSVVGNNQ